MTTTLPWVAWLVIGIFLAILPFTPRAFHSHKYMIKLVMGLIMLVITGVLYR